MASGSAFKTYHSALTPNTPDVVDLVVHSRYITVINKGSDAIYVTTDGSVPEAAGEPDTYLIAPNSSRLLPNRMDQDYPMEQVYGDQYGDGWSGGTRLALISAGSPSYGVEKT